MTEPGHYTYLYPRPSVTVDALLLTVKDGKLAVLLVQRKNDPFAGLWALPGGFVDQHEPLRTAALRELREETGVEDVDLAQLHAFGDPGRDPRGHTVAVAFLGIIDWQHHPLCAADDAADAAWMPVETLPCLAFDHNSIVEYAVNIVRACFGAAESNLNKVIRNAPGDIVKNIMK